MDADIHNEEGRAYMYNAHAFHKVFCGISSYL